MSPGRAPTCAPATHPWFASGPSSPELLDRKLADLTPWLVEKWRLRRKGDGIGTVTLNRDLDDLKAALARAAEWGMVAA
ncbi:MAG: Integrase, partial [Geminicoccaceae bacterium]|nr:Integrase [Geminicoccaceae bacterium]